MNNPAVHIMVDAHVHIHEHFQLDRLFLICLQNFRKALNQYQIYTPFDAFLLLTESAGVNQFERLVKMIETENDDRDFTVSATKESSTVCITTGGGQHLYVVAGKQIVTSEKLEVLALGYHDNYPDGRSLSYVLEDLNTSRCLRVLPWGAGKWLGRRGQIIESLISSWNNDQLFLGDNGNRPSFWPLPGLFGQAYKKNIHNLPGSDPLPFTGQEKKVGSFGFFLRGHVEHEKPFGSLINQVTSAADPVITFGAPESFTPFVKNQISMQIVKRCR